MTSDRDLQRVGFNVLYLVPGAVGGSETYARELVKALVTARPETLFYLYCGREARESLRALTGAKNFVVRALPVRCSQKPLRILAEYLLLPLFAWRDRVQVLHSLGNTAPPFMPGRSVVSVLDLIFHHFPNTFPPLARRGLEALVPLAVRRADRVIAISRYTKQDLIAEFGADPGSVDVVYLGCGIEAQAPQESDVERVRSRHGLGDASIVLTVASGLEHKNLARLLEAFAAWLGNEIDSSTKLVIVGHAGLESPALEQKVSELDLSRNVIMTGWVESEDLLALYATSECFIYPSSYEGFGIPVLEAMRRGTPVACSDTTSLPEVAGDAALMFDPTDTTAIASAIERMLSDSALRERLVAAGRERATGFTWTAAAEGTWKSYLAACSND